MTSYIVQSIQLSREKFGRREAFEWIHKHKYRADKVDMTPQYYRFRQVDPAMLHHGRFRTVELGDDGYMTLYYAGSKKA
jgi:hypothetical protein